MFFRFIVYFDYAMHNHSLNLITTFQLFSFYFYLKICMPVSLFKNWWASIQCDVYTLMVDID